MIASSGAARSIPEWEGRSDQPLADPPRPARLTAPLVSVVIPVLNEEAHIEACLDSVFAQTYPPERIEVVVADGGSDDRTREIVGAIAAAHANVRLIDNPGRNQAAGLNLAIAQARGDVIARLDGHAAWRPWHIERCVALLDSTGADNVGGSMEAIGETPVAAAVALATSSPFGVGGARFHYATTQQDVDTVFLGCFRREALERVGRFNESYPPHEDYELNHRIRSSGGRILFSPEIPTTYWARATWRSVARQYFRYGRAKMRVARAHPGVLRPHHAAAPAFVAVLALAAVGLASRRGRPIAAGGLGVYAASCVIAALATRRDVSVGVRVRVPFVFPVLHVSWGAGFWSGLRPRTPSRGKR
jgi:succinoglycan biosynthesis protein ExoA